jgi:HlyD family secretion protein
MADKTKIFREKALERLSSPESLDQLMRIAPARDWLWLGALGFLIVSAVAWSIVGRLPTAVTARGILIHPRTMMTGQSVTSGRLETLNIKPGDVVHKGDVIGTLGNIDETEIRRRLQEDRALLLELQIQDRAKISLQQERTALQANKAEVDNKFLATQQQTLTRSLAEAEAFGPTIQKRLDSLRRLQGEGILPTSSGEVVQLEQSYLDNQTKIADLKTRLQQLEGQSKQLDTDLAALNQENLEATTARQNQIREVATRITLSEIQLEKNTRIQSDYSGRVVEVLATAGKVVAAGERIATIEVNAAESDVVAIAYFPIGDGKKIKPGMTVQITPDTVERQRYGGILGVVSSVSALPVTRESSTVVLGNPDVVQDLMPNGPYIEVACILQRDPSTTSGYKWSSSAGPPVKMSAGLTGTVRATVEERAPITYVFPFLRSLSGVQ